MPPAGCRPAQFWLTARHGTRYPGEEDIELMSRRLPQLQRAVLSNAAQGRGERSWCVTGERCWKLVGTISGNLNPNSITEYDWIVFEIFGRSTIFFNSCVQSIFIFTQYLIADRHNCSFLVCALRYAGTARVLQQCSVQLWSCAFVISIVVTSR